jgi:RHS repeat-associated protein
MSYLSATYTYDQENRLSSTAGTSYTYDGNGERLLKSNTSTGAAVKRYWSMGGNTLAESDGSGILTAEYIYFGGKRIARIDLPANTVHYYLSDHLGSTSVVVSAAGTVEEESDYYPFGTEIVVTGPGTNELKFTGKRRDSESQLDYFGARYYSDRLGRFVAPDWSVKIEPVPYSKLGNPQTLNLYSYVVNNPLGNIDTDGHACLALYGNSSSGFCERASEYGRIDANPTVRSQTRFFAAANAVSQALADVAAWRIGTAMTGVSRPTANFLEGVGQRLEAFNKTQVDQIQSGKLSGPGLDQRMVHAEQTNVQRQLDNLKQADPSGYAMTIKEINGALNGIVSRGLEELAPTDRAYAQVLAGVRTDLGRDIDFSKQGDREAIGNALINHVRKTGGCDINGKKQPGC